jgi:hypothetical protein
MAVRADIAGVVNNDVSFTFSLTYNDLPLDLTSLTVTVTVKPSQVAPDSAGTVYSVSGGLTMLSAVAGRFTLAIPHSATATAGKLLVPRRREGRQRQREHMHVRRAESHGGVNEKAPAISGGGLSGLAHPLSSCSRRVPSSLS